MAVYHPSRSYGNFRHKVEAPEVNKDYYQQFAVPPLLPRSTVKITTELE